jgi:hypothetical protein
MGGELELRIEQLEQAKGKVRSQPKGFLSGIKVRKDHGTSSECHQIDLQGQLHILIMNACVRLPSIDLIKQRIRHLWI